MYKVVVETLEGQKEVDIEGARVEKLNTPYLTSPFIIALHLATSDLALEWAGMQSATVHDGKFNARFKMNRAHTEWIRLP